MVPAQVVMVMILLKPLVYFVCAERHSGGLKSYEMRFSGEVLGVGSRYSGAYKIPEVDQNQNHK